MSSDSDVEGSAHESVHSKQASSSSPQANSSSRDKKASPTLEYDNPFDFSTSRKWIITVTAACLTFTATFASSVFSSTITVTSEEFHVSETVMLLGVALYVLGFALGPVVWAPLSEVYGRRIPLFIGYTFFLVMQIPLALAPNLPAIFICRFLAGAFGSSPMVLVSALYADFWEPAMRGIASAVYSVAVYAGPTCGPLVGSFITESKLGWRWTAWITLIMGAAAGPMAFFCVPETYGPVLKERALSKQNGGNDILSRTTSRISKEASKNFFRKFLLKPVIMLGCEPMLLVMTIYVALAYGIMYLTFYCFPYSFSVERGWKPQIGSLPFLSLLVGVLAGCLMTALYGVYYYQPRLKARRGKVVPEDRLPLIMAGGICLPVGLFWFAWTSSPHILWVPQVMSGFFIGSGIMLVFTNSIALIIDIYMTAAASALAANTIVRSAAGAALPLAGPALYRNLGTQWATSLLGFLCLALVPAPFLFYRYGERLRKMSRFAPTPQE